VEREQVVASLRQQGLSTPEIAAETGLHERNVAQALEHVQIADEAYDKGFAAGVAAAEIDPAKFYKSVQEQASRIRRQMDFNFTSAVERAVMAKVDDLLADYLPKLQERERKVNLFWRGRRGIMSRADYMMIRALLHGEMNASPERLRKAHDLWVEKEAEIAIVETATTEAPSLPPLDIPSSREELEARRQKVKDGRAAQLRAKREAKAAKAAAV
jgi:lambda repressor-like predicted transcriptional regulator